MKNPWVIIAIIAIFLFGGAFWYSNTSNEKNNEGVVLQDQIKGNAEATVTLVEYSDFQCPACAAFQPVVEQVLSTYGDQVRFEYKHFPLPIHPYALQAGVAAEAAGQQDKFFEFHDLLFANQTAWANSPTPNVLFMQYAEELDLDVDMFRRHMNSSILKERVRSQTQEGRDLSVTGTPTFFLNGEKMQIATYEDFVVQVSEAIDPTISFGDGETTVPEDTTPVTFGL